MEIIMAMEVLRSTYHGFEIKWNIENFYCWDREVHSLCISTNSLRIGNTNFDLSVFPRGFSGDEEYLSLKIHDERVLLGEVIFTNDSGLSSVLTVNPVRDGRDGFMILRSNIRFRDVCRNVTQEHSHEDFMTLRYRGICRIRRPFEKVCLNTRIDVFDSRFTILCESLVESISSREPFFADISSLQGNEIGRFRLVVTGERGTDNDVVCKGQLRPVRINNGALVHLYIYLLRRDFSLNLKFYYYKIIFNNNQNFVFRFNLKNKALDDTCLKFRFKMVSGETAFTEGTVVY